MIRTTIFLALVLSACGNGSSSGGGGTGGSSGGGGLLDKVKAAGDKVGGALDKLDTDEVSEKLAAAKTSIANGLEAVEECAWAARADATNEKIKPTLEELRKLCAVDAPIGKATVAVKKAEAAKAEQPGAPSYTECSSDDYGKAKTAIEAGPAASDARWTDLKARWTKVCGNQ